MRIISGIQDAHLAQATTLYWEAFGAKLNIAMGPKAKAHRFVARVLDPTHAISAVDDTGALLGIAGFKTASGALVNGDLEDLRAIYGAFGSLWRAAVLNLLERDIENERFLMDGIFVAPAARGKGVGTALLDAIHAEAHARGYSAVRLDVIDTNPRARALYERKGYVPLKTEHLGPLRYLFGFASATTMVRKVSPPTEHG